LIAVGYQARDVSTFETRIDVDDSDICRAAIEHAEQSRHTT